MKIKSTLSHVYLKSVEAEWWTRTDYMEQLFRLLQKCGILNGLRVWSPRSDNPTWKKIESREELSSKVQEWTSGTYKLLSEPVEEPRRQLYLRLNQKWLDVKYFMRSDGTDDISPAINQMVDFVVLAHDEYGHDARIGPKIGVGSPFELSIPDIRPPHQFQTVKKFHMIDAFCADYYEHEVKAPRRQEYEKLVSLETPNWVERREEGDLVLFRWVDRYDDLEHIRERMIRRLRWLTEHLDPLIHPDYTEQGDRRANPSVRGESEYLTIYNPVPRHGYKATICREDGSIDEELFETLEEWLEAGETPDGEELRTLHLILPSREAALRIRDRAEELGAERVLYMGEDGDLWDPFPPGEWLEDEEQSEPT